MKRLCLFVAAVGGLALSLVGCTGAPSAPSADHSTGPHVDQEQASSLAKLNDEDRLSATAQGFCAVTSEPLGSMGAPLKLSIQDQTIWVCCKGCEKKALANPDKTLAKVAELKARVTATPAGQSKDK